MAASRTTCWEVRLQKMPMEVKMTLVFLFLNKVVSILMEVNSEDSLKNPLIASHKKPKLPSGLNLLIYPQAFKQTVMKC